MYIYTILCVFFFLYQMVATKFYSGHDDEAPYVNWSECINTTPDNLLQMELSFLNAIDWKVYVSNEDFFEKVKTLEIILAQQQGMKRGFYTYLEMSNLIPSVQMAKQFLQSVLVLSFGYTVLVASMVASVFLASQIPGIYLSSQTSGTPSSNQLSSENSSSSQQIETNEVTNIFSTTSELIESNSDLKVLLNLALDRLYETPNTTTLYSTWYSLLKIDSFIWPASTCDYGTRTNSNLVCNSTAGGDFVSFPPDADPSYMPIPFYGIKIKWA